MKATLNMNGSVLSLSGIWEAVKLANKYGEVAIEGVAPMSIEDLEDLGDQLLSTDDTP